MTRSAGRLQGKIALVTGAGSGIGRAVCVRLAGEGAKVVVTSRNPEHVEETCAEVERATGRTPAGFTVDMTDPAGIAETVGKVIERVGALDILSNNAGVDLPHAPAVADTTDEDWERIFRVNVTGIFQTCRAALPGMRDGGSIVNMASINSIVAWPNDAPYTATKGALLQFSRALALETAARRIRVNAVCPGVIDTPMIDEFLDRADDPAALRAEYAAMAPLGRLGSAREVADCVLFLASDESSFVTGSALVVDGGTTAM